MLPPVSHAKWKELVTGKKSYQFQSLGIKIMMSRILISTSRDQSPQNVDRCIQEVYNYFTKNEKGSQKDLEQIFGKEAR
jgi:hypothetical protein